MCYGSVSVCPSVTYEPVFRRNVCTERTKVFLTQNLLSDNPTLCIVSEFGYLQNKDILAYWSFFFNFELELTLSDSSCFYSDSDSWKPSPVHHTDRPYLCTTRGAWVLFYKPNVTQLAVSNHWRKPNALTQAVNAAIRPFVRPSACLYVSALGRAMFIIEH